VWHPVICSPSEEFVWAYLDNKTAGLPGENEEPDESGFYTKIYTVELVDMVVSEDEEYKEEADEWNNSWEEIEDYDLYSTNIPD